MEKNQKINCTVNSCKFHKDYENICTLEQIQVEPTNGCKTKNTDESMCGSYQYTEN